MQDKILEIIRGIQPYEEIDEETQLMTNDILDSLEFAELVMALENEFHISIPEEMVNEENFQTLITIEGLVKRLV